jgi:hypothetical protein
LTGQKDIVNLQLSAQQNMQNQSLGLQERIANRQIDLSQQGLNLQSAQLYGYTNEFGNHVSGSLEIAQQTLGLQGKTLQDQENELYGYDDANGNHVAGKIENMNESQKLQAAQVYGYNDPVTGKHVNGTLENQQMLSDIQSKSFFGYTDQNGNYIAGSGEIAAKQFDLQAKTFEDQEKELYGYQDPQTGAYIPGKMQIMSDQDKQAADKLYGYIDPTTGLKVAGELQLQADANSIQQQGMTLDEARTKGYTNAKGEHVKGSLELGQYQVDQQSSLEILKQSLDEKTLDYKQVLAEDATIQQAKATTYYTRGLNGETIDPTELQSIASTDPLAYQSFLMGKAGKTQTDLQRVVDLTNQYRASQIENIDDANMDYAVSKMFASWGVSEAGAAVTDLEKQGAVTPASIAAADKNVIKFDASNTNPSNPNMFASNGNVWTGSGTTTPLIPGQKINLASNFQVQDSASPIPLGNYTVVAATSAKDGEGVTMLQAADGKYYRTDARGFKNFDGKGTSPTAITGYTFHQTGNGYQGYYTLGETSVAPTPVAPASPAPGATTVVDRNTGKTVTTAPKTGTR